MSLVLDLLSLQALDDEAATAQLTLAEIERRLGADEALNASRRDFAAAEEHLAAAQKDQRRLDADIQGLSAKITPEETRLYSGSVTSPKELRNIQHEIDLLKQHRSQREDELLEVLSRVETAEQERSSTLRTVETHEMRRSQDVQALRQESARLNESLTRVQARRLNAQAAIDVRTLAVYDELRLRKGGRVVVRVSGQSCSGCRVQLPDTVRRRAMSTTQLAQCPNCERILAVA